MGLMEDNNNNNNNNNDNNNNNNNNKLVGALSKVNHRGLHQGYNNNSYNICMAHSSQTRIFGEVDGQILYARWWL